MAAARMGLRTALYTINLDLVAQMSCNPAVGGIAKGHLVREIDALGGIMGEVIDAVGIQFRLLNTSRGPAVWSPRAQADKKLYRAKMRQVLESEPNLRIKQAEVIDLVIEEMGTGASTLHLGAASAITEPAGRVPSLRVRGIRLLDGRIVEAGAVIVTTGTFLNGLIHCGENQYAAGRSGEPPSLLLGEALRRLGFEVGRLKTGTPPRLDARTIDFSHFQVQAGDPIPTPFSFRTGAITQPQTVCWITHTNAETQRIIQENVHRAPLYSGQIKGIGPRYCPSIEDKIVKFPGKSQHQLFLEPEGLDTNEIYVNGMSTSHADRCADGDGEIDTRSRTRGYDSPRLCHRIRHGAADRTLPVARNQEDSGSVSRRADQRNHRLRRGRLPGHDGGDQCRAARAGQSCR